MLQWVGGCLMPEVMSEAFGVREMQQPSPSKINAQTGPRSCEVLDVHPLLSIFLFALFKGSY